LNRKNYVKFARKLNKKSSKTCCVKNSREKRFGPQLRPKACFARAPPCAGINTACLPLHSPAKKAYGTLACCLSAAPPAWPSDRDRTADRAHRQNKTSLTPLVTKP
jgi:hypothetical protein